MRRVPLLLLIALAVALPAGASSHREAPGIAADPAIDATDLYAFVSPDRPDTVTLIANYIPVEAAYGGPNFFGFADWPAAQYEIHVDNNGDAVEDVTFLFQFRTETANGGTFLYNTGPINVDPKPKGRNAYTGLNVYQYYRVFMVKGPRRAGEKASELLGEFLPVAPNNVGPKSIKDYDSLAKAAVREVKNGVKVFAGPRDDPFFINLGRTFDLLNIDPVLPGGRDQDAGKAPDHLAGFNVHTIALQIPIPLLMGPSPSKTAGWPVPADDPSATIGVWTTASRAKTTTLKAGGRDTAGEWVQVSRLGMPLVNEVVIPRSHKDLFNASEPKDDAQFLPFVQTSELAGLFNALFKVKVPANPRADLVQVFLKGVPKLNEKGVPCEYLRLNMAVPPSAQPSRLGLLAGQNDGFPNGRRPGDDIVDIALRVVAGVLDAKYNVSPNNELGDTVVKNDKPFLTSFPYLAPPFDGVNIQ